MNRRVGRQSCYTLLEYHICTKVENQLPQMIHGIAKIFSHIATTPFWGLQAFDNTWYTQLIIVCYFSFQAFSFKLVFILTFPLGDVIHLRVKVGDVPDPKEWFESSLNLSIYSSSPACLFWDEAEESWSHKGCVVSFCFQYSIKISDPLIF